MSPIRMRLRVAGVNLRRLFLFLLLRRLLLLRLPFWVIRQLQLLHTQQLRRDLCPALQRELLRQRSPLKSSGTALRSHRPTQTEITSSGGDIAADLLSERLRTWPAYLRAQTPQKRQG
jgi:hypothetical protein